MPQSITIAELTPDADRRIGEICDGLGVHRVTVLSRVVEWLTEQPDQVRATILHRLTMDGQESAAEIILRLMAGKPRA